MWNCNIKINLFLLFLVNAKFNTRISDGWITLKKATYTLLWISCIRFFKNKVYNVASLEVYKLVIKLSYIPQCPSDSSPVFLDIFQCPQFQTNPETGTINHLSNVSHWSTDGWDRCKITCTILLQNWTIHKNVDRQLYSADFLSMPYTASCIYLVNTNLLWRCPFVWFSFYVQCSCV